jgi:hypothetical protein
MTLLLRELFSKASSSRLWGVAAAAAAGFCCCISFLAAALLLLQLPGRGSSRQLWSSYAAGVLETR